MSTISGKIGGIGVVFDTYSIVNGRNVAVYETANSTFTKSSSGGSSGDTAQLVSVVSYNNGTITDLGNKIPKLTATVSIYSKNNKFDDSRKAAEELLAVFNKQQVIQFVFPDGSIFNGYPGEITSTVENNKIGKYTFSFTAFRIPNDTGGYVQSDYSDKTAALADAAVAEYTGIQQSIIDGTAVINDASLNVESLDSDLNKSLMTQPANFLDKLLNQYQTFVDKISDATSAVTDITSKLNDVINLPGEYIGTVRSAYNTVTSSLYGNLVSLRAQFDCLKNFSCGFNTYGLVNTDKLKASGITATNIEIVMKSLAFADACDIIANTAIVTSDDADYYVNLFSKAKDDMLSLMDGDATVDVSSELNSAHAAVVYDLRNRAALLPSLVTYESNNQTPLIVTSYELYGTIDNEEDIIDRNNVRNPLFPPTTIKVVSNKI